MLIWRRFLHSGQFGQVLFPGGNYIGDDQYMNFVQNQFQMTRGTFEELLKKEIERVRLQQMITGGASVGDNEVRDSYRISGTKVKFDYAVLSSDEIGKTLNPERQRSADVSETECGSLCDGDSRDSQD